MYEILIKWGLDTLGKAKGQKADYELKLLIEAAKTKNNMVVERFRIASDMCARISELSIELDNQLDIFQKEAKKEGKPINVEKYINRIKRDFHPKYYRDLKRILTRSNSTNDILAAYAEILISFINYGNIKKILNRCEIKSLGEVSRMYRSVWDKGIFMVTSALRASANDLRFWLTDHPYRIEANEWGKKNDQRVLFEYLTRKKNIEKYYFSLDHRNKLEEFWDYVSKKQAN